MISTQAFDLNRNVLIANVKRDNVEHFLDGSARLYYLGKHVPKALSLNALHYFVPYIGKQCGQPYSGIRDLYLIRKARSGCRREGEADKDASDERIVLELQFVARLFPEYRKQKLLIAHTFTSTTLGELLVQHQAIAPAEPAPRMEPKESIINNIQININMDNKEKWLDILGKGGIVVNGDFVVGDKVQHKVEKVEAGGIGFQISQADVPRLTASEQEVIEVCDNENEPSADNEFDHTVMLSPARQTIFSQLLDLADKGDWVNGVSAQDVKAMLKTVLGLGETQLSAKETEQSETLWHLLENGRGDRVTIVWQNMVGYLDDKKLFRLKGSPALNKDFFCDDKGYPNIDKGRPSKGLMTADFESIIPLLDAYVPKVG